MPLSETYNRIVKTASGQGTNGQISGVSDYVPFMAAINLTERAEMMEFINDYRLIYPDYWLNNLIYALEHTNMEIRTLWKREVGDIVPIDPYMQRSEFELYIDKEFTDKKGELVKLRQNKERGQHQSYGEKVDEELELKIHEIFIDERDTRYLPGQIE